MGNIPNEPQGSFYFVSGEMLEAFASSIVEATAKKIVSLQNAEKAQHDLSVNEVCELLNVSKPTLWRWNKVGYLKHTMVGGRRYYKQSEVNVILERKGGKYYE
jgi:excisionase family DNA binding protein